MDPTHLAQLSVDQMMCRPDVARVGVVLLKR